MQATYGSSLSSSFQQVVVAMLLGARLPRCAVGVAAIQSSVIRLHESSKLSENLPGKSSISSDRRLRTLCAAAELIAL